MKKNTYIISACFLILIAGCLYYFFKEEPFQQEVTSAPTEQQSTTLSYVGNRITEEKDGKPLWEMNAETIEIDVNTKNILLKNIKGTFYQDNGGKINITAPQAMMDNKTKDIRMSGKVYAVASDGGTFTAQETQWAGQTQLFYGSGDVICTKDDMIMYGDVIESDKNMVVLKVSGHAKMVKGGAPK